MEKNQATRSSLLSLLLEEKVSAKQTDEVVSGGVHDDNEMRCSEEADPFDDTIMYLIRRNTFFFASEHTYLK